MRTTLNIEDDVHSAAVELARREKMTLGQVISAMARQGLTGATDSAESVSEAAYGFRPFPAAGRIVSNELINKLREGGGY